MIGSYWVWLLHYSCNGDT